MPFKNKDVAPLTGPKGEPLYGPQGVLTQAISESYDAVYVQNVATGEVTVQSPKSVPLFFSDRSTFRILTEESGRRKFDGQRRQDAQVFSQNINEQVADLEVDADDDEDSDTDSDTDDEGLPPTSVPSLTANLTANLTAKPQRTAKIKANPVPNPALTRDSLNASDTGGGDNAEGDGQ